MLSRFFRYVEKVFDFGSALGTLTDGRVRPQRSTESVWLSAFLMFAMRRGSLHAMEQDLRVPKRLDDLLGSSKPSADTIGRVMGRINTQQLRRNKALVTNWPLRFAAVDGHECFSLPAS